MIKRSTSLSVCLTLGFDNVNQNERVTGREREGEIERERKRERERESVCNRGLVDYRFSLLPYPAYPQHKTIFRLQELRA